MNNLKCEDCKHLIGIQEVNGEIVFVCGLTFTRIIKKEDCLYYEKVKGDKKWK